MKLSAIALLTTILLGCNKNNAGGQSNPPASNTTTVTYVAVQTDFPNPDRGFYRYSQTKASNYSPLNLNELKGYRMGRNVTSGSYTVVSSLVFRYFVLDGFNNAPLSDALLNNIRADFDVARQAGVKLIPRFT